MVLFFFLALAGKHQGPFRASACHRHRHRHPLSLSLSLPTRHYQPPTSLPYLLYLTKPSIRTSDKVQGTTAFPRVCQVLIPVRSRTERSVQATRPLSNCPAVGPVGNMQYDTLPEMDGWLLSWLWLLKALRAYVQVSWGRILPPS